MENFEEKPYAKFDSENPLPLPSLDLSIYHDIPPNENEEIEDEEDDDIEEVEVDENERLHLEKVTSLVEAAYQRVEQFAKQEPLVLSSTVPSEVSSTQHFGSVPESLDGGKTEVDELKNLNPTFESALRINQALQRRLTNTLNRLQKTLQQNLLRQAQLKEDEEEHGLLSSYDKDCKEYRSKYHVKPSSFAIPYFKDRGSTPAPMNEDSKYKVDHGYLDLYSTRLRTWLTAEQNLLVKAVQKEWKQKLVNDWSVSLKNAERKLKNCPVLEEEERRKLTEEIESCQNHFTFFSNVPDEKIDMPPGSEIDWDKVAAQAFDGFRTPEECQLLWDNHLHPSINKSIWTMEEDIQIQETVLNCKSGRPNWGEVARELGTNRTAFQVMQRWVSFIKPTIQPARWTAEASKKLEDTINMLRVGSHIPWAQVSQHLTGYTKVQLQSRWRVINPDTSKGPFTSEEDFILIKGLYKFGLNFDVIAHFLPGRNKVQVRDRFKRAILPGLTSNPWKWREDKKIIKNCSKESQHWRLMVSLLPKRDTCQIRLRFYILRMWQTLSKDKMQLPPPLFPLALTTKPAEVKELREKILKFDPSVRILLDSIQQEVTDMALPNSLKPFEDRREAICKLKKKETLAKFLREKSDDHKEAPKIVRRRKRGGGGPRTQTWPDRALTEFFLPGRSNAIQPLQMEDMSVTDNYHRISQALQLKIKKAVTAEELEKLKKEVEIKERDALLVNNVSVMHHEIENYDNECLSCHTQNPDIVPLIPPNLMTTGAFRSLLLHKMKLEEMASKEFLLFEVPSSQLHKLGDKPKTLNKKIINKHVEIPNVKIKKMCEGETLTVQVTPEDEEEEEKEEENEGDPKKEKGPKRKRKAAAVANIVNYVYSQEEVKPKLLKESVSRSEVFEPPNKRELVQMQLEGENPCFRTRTMNTQTKDEIIEDEDRLLFHRILSLFFWPALFTLRKPSADSLHLARELAKEKKYEEMSVPDELFPIPDNPKGKKRLAQLDIEEVENLIKKMEAVKQRKECKFGSFFTKTEVPITQEDMKLRIYRKGIVQLKRSLVMKKAWEKRRLGLLQPKQKKKKKKTPKVSQNRRTSKRIASRIYAKKGASEEEEEEEEEQEQEEALQEEGAEPHNFGKRSESGVQFVVGKMKVEEEEEVPMLF